MKNKRRYILHIICAFLAFFCTIGVGYSIWTYDQYVFNDAENELTKAETYAEACVITSSETKYFLKFVNAVNYANAITEEPVEVKALVKQKIGGAYVATTITLKQDLVINENVTLTLPYFNGDDSTCLYKKMFDSDYSDNSVYDTLAVSKNLADCYSTISKYSLLKLSITSGYTLTNYGRINIAGRHNGSGGGHMAGYTYGGTITSNQGSLDYTNTTAYFSEIILNGTAKYISYGTTVCFGFIRGVASGDNKPEIKFHSGSSTYIPFVVIEHRGGSTFSNLDSLDGSPFNRLFFPNFYTVTTYLYGTSKLYSLPDLYAGSQHNRTIIELIGNTDSCLINVSASNDSQFLMKNYFSYKSITYTSSKDGAEKTVKTPRHDLDFYGSFAFNYLNLKINYIFSITLSTSSCYFPVSCYFNISLNVMEGMSSAKVKSAGQKIKVLPGASLTINEGVTADLIALANYPGESSGNTRYGVSSDGKTDGIEGRDGGATLYELIDKDGEVIINGTLKADYLSGFYTTNSATSKIIIGNQNSDTLYEVSPTDRSFYNFSLTATGKLYQIDGASTLLANSTYYGDTDHWDGNGVVYPITFENVHQGSATFDASLITNNTYPSTVDSTVELPTPSYTGGDYIFAGYYASTDFTDIINPGTRSAGDLSAAFSTSTHSYKLYVRWVESSAEKVQYRIDKYNGTSNKTNGETTIALIGASYSNFEIDRRATTFTSSEINTYEYSGWKAKIYTDDTLASLASEVTVSDSFEFSSANGVSNGNYIIFEPYYAHNTYSAPSITLSSNSSQISASGTCEITAVVTNYRDDVFDIMAAFQSKDTDNLTVDNVPTVVSRDGTTVTFKTTVTNQNSGTGSSGSCDIVFGVLLSIVVDDIQYASLDSTLYYKTISQSYEESSGWCLLPDTLITMADGSKKPVKDVKSGDLVRVFNHETGKIDIAPITFNDYESAAHVNVINLEFSNGKSVGVVSEHGFFDLDTMRYEYIDEHNYQEFIGHRFYSETGEAITLDNAYVNTQFTEVYSPTSFFHLDYFVEGILSMPGGITGLFNIFEYGENLQYDQEAYARDIETYGLFNYEDLAPLGITEIMFEAYAGKYLKVALSKGILTEEYLAYLVERYGGFTD